MILRNAVIRTIGSLATVAVGIVTTPILTGNLGQTDYGLWLLLMSLMAYTGIVDLGLTTALTKHLASRLALNDHEAVNRLLSTGFLFYLLTSLLVAAYYLVMVAWCGDIFNVPPERLEQVRWALSIIMVAGVLSFPNRAVEAVLLAQEHHYVLGVVTTVSELIRLFLIVTVFYLGGRFIALALIYAAVLVGGFAATFIMARRLTPDWFRWRPGWHLGSAKELFTYVRVFCLNTFGESTRDQAPTLILGAQTVPAEVAVFGLGNRLIFLSRALMGTAAGVSMSRFASLSSLDANEEMRTLFSRITLHSGLMGGLASLGLFFLGPAFIELWVGPAYRTSGQVAQVLALPLFLYMAVFPCYVVLQGLGKLRVTAILNVGEAVLAAGVCWWVAVSYGAVGAAAVLGAAMVIFRIWVLPLHTCRLLELGHAHYWRLTLLRPVLATGLTAFCWWVIPLAQSPSWLGLLAQGALLVLLFMVFGWTLALRGDDRALWRERLGGYARALKEKLREKS